MAATSAISKKFKLGAKPPKRLSPEACQLLENSPLSKKAIDTAARIVKLKIVDGSEYGF